MLNLKELKTKLEIIIDKDYIKTQMSKEEFIELFEAIGSSRVFTRYLKGRVTRGFLDSYYLDCLHKPYSIRIFQRLL